MTAFLRAAGRVIGACAKLVLLLPIRFYQVCISPMHPPCCRYIPTCSEYAKTAIERFGAIRGGLLAGWRLLRCNPFSHGGYDPVPDNWSGLKKSKQAPEKGAQ